MSYTLNELLKDEVPQEQRTRGDFPPSEVASVSTIWILSGLFQRVSNVLLSFVRWKEKDKGEGLRKGGVGGVLKECVGGG